MPGIKYFFKALGFGRTAEPHWIVCHGNGGLLFQRTVSEPGVIHSMVVNRTDFLMPCSVQISRKDESVAAHRTQWHGEARRNIAVDLLDKNLFST